MSEPWSDDECLLDGYSYAVRLQTEVRNAEARLLGKPITRWDVDLQPNPVDDSSHPVVLPQPAQLNKRRSMLLLALTGAIRRGGQLAVLLAKNAGRHAARSWAPSP